MAEIKIHENESSIEQIKHEHDVFWKVDKVTVDGGIKQHLAGAKFPKRGQCSPETMMALNQSKRLFIESAKLFGSWQFILAILFTKDKLKFIKSYNSLVWQIMNPHILKYDYMSPLGQELQDFSYDFLIKLGLDEDNSVKFSKIFSHLIEYDDAYRYRVGDILTETNKEWIIKHTREEINRLVSIAMKRDAPGVADKFKKVGMLLSLALLVPSIKRKFIEALEGGNFEKLQFEDEDKYWAYMRMDYKFGGMEYNERLSLLKSLGWDLPSPMKGNVK